MSYQWPIVIALWIGFMALGYIGFGIYYQEHPLEAPHAAGDLVYYAMQLVSMESGAPAHEVPWQLEVARHLLPIIETYAVVVALIILFAAQVRRLRLRCIRDHVVICGLGCGGALLARHFRALGYPTVAIESDPGGAPAEEGRDQGVLVVGGDATVAATLHRAGVGRAACLIALDGDDAASVGIVVGAGQLCADRRRRPLTCVINIVEPRLYEVLRAEQLQSGAWPGLRLDVFNTLDAAARALLDEYRLPSERPPRVVLVGLGALGSAVLLRAALDWRPQQRSGRERMRAHLIDSHASELWESLCASYPHLNEVCEACPRDVDAASATADLDAIVDECLDGNQPDVAFVCLEDEAAGVVAGLELSRLMRGAATRLVVAVSNDGGLASLVSLPSHSPLHKPVAAFPIYGRICTPARVLGGMHETLAVAIHDEYVFQQRALGETNQTNPSLVPWDELPLRLQEANRSQADHIGVKLVAIGCGLESLTDWDADLFAFKPDEIERLAMMEHERWLDDYRAAGWRYAAGEKSAAHRTHPSIIPWAELSEAEREKDRDAARLLPVFLARSGLQVVRPRPLAKATPRVEPVVAP